MTGPTPDDLSSMPPDNGEREPIPELRNFAAFLRGMFNALLAEGFTEQQALAMLGHTIKGIMGGSQ